jgi:hypothetical protein
MEIWQRLDSLKRSWDFDVLGRVTRNRGKVMGLEPLRDRRAGDICLTLMTSTSPSSPSDMSCAGMLLGRWRNTALMGFSDLG